MRFIAGLLLSLVVVCAAIPAQAETELEAIRRGELAEKQLKLPAAVRAYREALESSPKSRLARRARARLDYLEARSEGGFVPLAALEQARRGAQTPERLRAFEKRIDDFPRGRVRRESWAFVADTRAGRLADPRGALAAYERWLAEPDLEPSERARATSGRARAQAAAGDLHGAVETLRSSGLGHSAQAVETELARLRRWARPLGAGVLALFALLCLALSGARGLEPRRLRSLPSPGRVAVLGWMLGVPALLASWYRPSEGKAMLMWALGATMVVGLAALWRVGSRNPAGRARWLVVALGVMSQFAVAYLALDLSRSLSSLVQGFR